MPTADCAKMTVQTNPHNRKHAHPMRHSKRILICLAALFCIGSSVDAAGVRIKDITHVHGNRRNQLVGLGLVTGLNGTGGNSPVTRQFALNMEQRLGVRADPATRARLDVDTTRITTSLSVVMVTADLPSYAKEGSELDVTVAAYDDASSLQGGLLVRTPLYGVDGEVYAVASGPVSIGGFNFAGRAGSVTQNHPTSGRIADGGTIEKETCTPVGLNGVVRLILHNPDYETARRMVESINILAVNSARIIDPATVETTIPSTFYGRPSEWISRIGSLEIQPDIPARVVINERTGTVVIGENVRISRVLITHSNLTVITVETPQVSQPAPFSEGETVVVPRTEIDVSEDGIAVTEVEQNITVGDLAFALNTLGVAPRDLSSIFQQLKESGALHAELEFK